ncbi:hypothetical protein EP331_03835 [bacterium]|nr:MAG: hypothetical protein EP331_03835 [bacterium]
MKIKQAAIFLSLAFLAWGCPQPVSDFDVTTDYYPPVFMYANGNGELRLLNIEFSDADTTYQVERLATLGTPTSFFGGVDLTWYNSYDISKYDEVDTLVRSIAVLNRVNPVNPTYNYMFQRQFVGINENRKIGFLEYYSELNKRYDYLLQWNYPLSGDRAVKFIDKYSYVLLYSDEWIERPNVEKPIDVPYSGRALHLLRYSFSALQSQLGEVITTFSIGDGRVDVYKDKPTSEGNNHLSVSANGEFFIVWAPYFNVLGYSPYILRTDGTLAFNPNIVKFSWTDRYFGQSMFAFEPSTTKDSVFAMGDINYRSVKIVELPTTLGTRFTELQTKSISELIPQAAGVSWAEFQRSRAWYMTFNSTGTKLIITHSLNGVDPVLVVWDLQTNAVQRYDVNSLGLDRTYQTMGKAEFAYNSANKSLLYFMAADTLGDDRADFFYIDINSANPQLNRINWDNMKFRNLPTETPDKATDLVGR